MAASQFPPMWQRRPEDFLLTHKSFAGFQLNEWNAAYPDLMLHQFVGRYIDGLPPDVPAQIILEITKILIEVWEKQAVGQKEAVAA